MTNTFNPFATSDVGQLANTIAGLLPKAGPMSSEKAAAFAKERVEGEARYQEARFGALPKDTYRILDQGGIAGWHYEVEIGNQTVILQEPGEDFSSAYAVHENPARVDELARIEIARHHGDEAAKRASFRVVWGGSL